MFLLPFIMEYEGPLNSRPKDESANFIRNYTFYDYIYLLKNENLLKFRVELHHMDVVNVLESYINSQKQYDNKILSEKEAIDTKIPLKFLYYLGKYRLEDNLIKTKNYLLPKQTVFLDLITEKYKDEIVDSTDLYNLNNIKTDAIMDEDDVTQELIDNLFRSANIEFVESFEISEEELNNTINNVRILLRNSRDSQDVLSKLKWILEGTKTNQEYITNLGLQERFDSAINKDKVKVKS